jgi:3-oxoacyl-[acyl-carrier protein] reductase
MDLALKDKKVLVTGSSRGIGLAIARGFLKEQAQVCITSRNQDDLNARSKELLLEFNDTEVEMHVCDFTVPDQIVLLRDEIIRRWGRLDILVNNVGSGKGVSDPIPSHDNFERIFRLNFDSAVYASRTFYELLRVSGGNIIFIASIAGMEAFGAPVDYSAAKGALMVFSKNLARKAAKDGIRVNCIAPGNIYFDGGTWARKMEDDPDRITQLIESTVPMARFGRPEEVADAAVFLSSERASFITGACLVIDGGQTACIF